MLKSFIFPLPPLPEQHRIVAKIEELFTKLDAGVESLKKAKGQLKRFRQAVLKYAFEGKLTEEWRKANKDKIEPASVLLERIKEERKKKAGSKYKESPPVDTSELHELPDGWVWVKLNTISDINPALDNRNLADDMEVSFVPMKSVEELTGHIDLSITKRFSEVKKGYTPFKNNDIIFAKITPCMENGKVAIINNLKNSIGFGSTEFHVIRLFESIPLKYLFFFLIQEWFRKDAKRNMTGSAGQLRVPAEYIRQSLIPFPPLPEQHKIVEEIERRLSVTDEVETVIDAELRRAERLRQSILKQAFSGKLVPQDPSDEPVGVLLERIKQEKANQAFRKSLSKKEARQEAERKPIKRSKYKPKPKRELEQMRLF